jgi:hypothetical protein
VKSKGAVNSANSLTAANFRGRLCIYSVPAALRNHVEWAIPQNIQVSNLNNLKELWVAVDAGQFGLEIQWHSESSTAPKLVNALKIWKLIRFEVSEFNAEGSVLYRATPDLGIHQANIDSLGNVILAESKIKSCIESSYSQQKLISNLESALGVAWDTELEPFRIAWSQRFLTKPDKILL